jgi:hypothetical protein
LSDELDIDEVAIAVLIDDVVGENAPNPAKAEVSGVVAT